MENHQWDLKSNYLLTFTVCKCGLKPDCWTTVANDLADHIKTTPENCRKQFDQLCEQYGQHWEAQSDQPFHAYIYSMIRRLYYGDLCERMTESRDLLMVMYDFIRLFKGGRITQSDVQDILHDVRESVVTTNSEGQLNEREEKGKMLERLKQHMTTRMSSTLESQESLQQSTYPIQLLPPPPFFQETLIIGKNDPQISPFNGHHTLEPKASSSIFPSTAQLSSVILEKEVIKSATPDEVEADEIELSSDDNDSDDDDDDDEHDRTATTMATSMIEDETHESTLNKPPTTATNSRSVNDPEDSSEIFEEPMETNESSNIQPVPDDISNSNDGDVYENVSSTASISNPSFNGHTSSHINGPPISSYLPLNSSIGSSNDHITSDSNPQASVANHSSTDTASMIVTPSLIPIQDDESARMDAEQAPEPVPADLTDIAVPNDNAVFAVEELVHDNIDVAQITPIDHEETTNRSAKSPSHETKTPAEVREYHASPAKKRRKSSPQTPRTSMSTNFRRAVNSILMNLKNAKYGSDFSKSLKSFKLHDDYYHRVKKPLDIPEIRQRMNNGDYDNNLILFERDVLLMLNNALCMYHREDDIHSHAQEMIEYAIELFTPLDEAIAPWKIFANGHGTGNGRHKSNPDYTIYGNDSDDDDFLQQASGIRTPSIASTTSSIRTDSSTRYGRTSATTPTHNLQKRQRKTTHLF